MSLRILANDGISPAGKLKLENLGYTVLTEHVQQDALTEFINEENISVLLVRSATKVRADLIDACKNLKLIGRGGVGLDNIDVDFANSKGIEVINTPAASSQSVAELVMGSLFSMVRMTYDANRKMPVVGNREFKDLKKKYSNGLELRGKTLGIVGTGRIGRSVASYAMGIGMKVLGYDAFSRQASTLVPVPNSEPVKVDINMVDLNTLFQVSDFITIHVPAQPDNKPLFQKAELDRMKNGVYLVNASRGGLIEEDTLIAALDSGKVAGATLDVFMNEPTPQEAILSHPKLITTPHIGAATLEAQERIGLELADKINDFFS
jgi:D-3-phosphoglycerate dehydrogenase